MSNVRHVNACVYPNDIKWIKHHLASHVDTMLEEIRNLLVYTVDSDKNAVFPSDISIEGQKEKFSLMGLFNNVKHLNELIGDIVEINDLDNVLTSLASIRSNIESMESTISGLRRDAYKGQTVVTDDIAFNNSLTIKSVGVGNAVLVGYGGKFGITTNTRIEMTENDGTTVMHATWFGDGVVYDYSNLYLFNFMEGRLVNANTENEYLIFDNVECSVTLSASDFEGLKYKIGLNGAKGSCMITKNEMTINVVLSGNSYFLRGTVEVEGMIYDQEEYAISSSDRNITFTSSNITYDPTTHKVQSTYSTQNPMRLTIGDNVFKIINLQDETGFATIELLDTTYLNAKVPSDSEESHPTEEQRNDFVRTYGLYSLNWSELESNGMKVSKYPTVGQNDINFETSGVINILANESLTIKSGGNDIIKTDNKTVNVKLLDGDNNLQDSAKFTSDGIETDNVSKLNSLQFKKADDREDVYKITLTGEEGKPKSFTFNGDAQFTYYSKSTPSVAITSKVSDLVRKDSARINQLENRIITLERNNWYQNSSMTDNAIFHAKDLEAGNTDEINEREFYNETDETKYRYHVASDNYVDN